MRFTFILFFAFLAGGQTLKLTEVRTGGMSAVLGDYLVVPELPRPEWRGEMGAAVARLRIEAPDAAAWQVTFRSLSLPAGSEMFLYGANGVHGPYEDAGPLNIPGFETQIIEGAALVVEIRGGPTTNVWPFQIASVERIGAPALGAIKEKGIAVEANYRPPKRPRPTREVRSAWVEDQLVRYQVMDGIAVMEGDIVLGPAAEIESGTAAKGTWRREAHETTVLGRLWPGGIIPYTIEYSPGGISAGSLLESKILGAINHINQRLPGLIVPRTWQTDFVTFRSDSTACHSPVGRRGGQQIIGVNNACDQGAIVHEMLHSVGMWHEHQRPDRDMYINVLWSNIDPPLWYNFEIPAAGTSQSIGLYDYGSVMHYDLFAGTVNPGSPTMQVLQPVPPGTVIGQRNGLSTGDEWGVRMRYCKPPVTVSPGSVSNASALGGTFNLSIGVALSYCAWTVSENSTWLTPWGSTTRMGSGVLTFTLSPNYGRLRSTVIYIADGNAMRVITVSQKGENNRL